MENKIKWKFEGLPAIFETESSKLDQTVVLLRKRNYLTYNHQIEILSNGNNTTIEPAADNVPASNSANNTKKRKPVSKSVKDSEPLQEATELLPVSNDVDNTDPESDVL